MTQDETVDSGVVAAPGPGAQLRQAREARGMSVAEVSASLKLSARQIEAAENDDFSRLSGATFVRGFIRNYARLLKIDAAPILAGVAGRIEEPALELNVPAGSGVRMPAGNERHGKGSIAAAVLAVGLLVVAIALYLDIFNLDAPLGWLAERRGALVARNAAPAGTPPAAQAVVQPAPTIVALASAEPEVVPAARAAVEAAPVTGAAQLLFSFDGNAWVEVKDGKGHTVFSQLSPKGSTQRVEGSPPFQIVVGNAGSVRLSYKEQMVDLRPHTRVEVARLTLE